MLRLKNLSNKYQKRLIRPEYAHTQATPYAASLHSSFRESDGDLRLPADADTGGGSTNPLNTRTDKAYTLKNSLIPGLVMVRVPGSETVAVATGVPQASPSAGGGDFALDVTLAEQPFGLLANFVGGDLDEGFAGDSLQNEVGVWRGVGSTYTLLAPAFNPNGLETDGVTSITGAQSLDAALTIGSNYGRPVLLYAGPDGRLTSYTDDECETNRRVPVARLIEKVSASRIVVDLLV
jgi:hypothetical protein